MATNEPAAQEMDLPALTMLRPAEIKTYHQSTYDRISPEKTLRGEGKTVLITAGATGIGLAIAASFAKAGVARLVLVQRRQDVLDQAKQALASQFPKTEIITSAASVTDHASISALVAEIGKIDILVVNAAYSHPFVASKDIATADFQATYDINVVATFHLVKEFLALESSGPRSVIYTSSAQSQILSPGNIGYGPSKAAANLMMQYFAHENAGKDVTFQAFHPGVIYTDAVAKLVPKDQFDWEEVNLPGNFAVWLASPEAKFLTGRYVWAQWDVDELLSLRERLMTNPALLTTTIVV